jgi:hypothetical protein
VHDQREIGEVRGGVEFPKRTEVVNIKELASDGDM